MFFSIVLKTTYSCRGVGGGNNHYENLETKYTINIGINCRVYRGLHCNSLKTIIY